MQLEMTERHVGEVTVLDLAGKLTTDQDAPRLKHKVNSLLQQGHHNIVLNMGAVPYIDSGGLGQLVSCYSAVAKANGHLKLVQVNKTNHDLLSISRLVTVFDVYDSEREALASF